MRADYFIARFRIIGSDFVGSVDADGSSIQYGTVHNRRVLYGQAHTPQPTGTRQGYNIHTVVSTSVFAPRARVQYTAHSPQSCAPEAEPDAVSIKIPYGGGQCGLQSVLYAV